MAIETIITAIPEPGHRGVDARDTFVTKQEAFQDALYGTTVDEMNDVATEMNTIADEVEADKDTVAADKAVVVEKEALMNPHYTEIGICADNIGDINAVGTAIISSNTQLIEANSSAYGYTVMAKKDARWLETDTPNVIVDKLGDDCRFLDGLYSRLGDEKVANGTFDSDTTGWTQESGATISSENGKLKIDGNAGKGAYQLLSSVTTVDKTYLVSFTGMLETSTDGYVMIYNGTALETVYLDGATELEFTFTRASESAISLYARTWDEGVMYFDNISVKELPQAELPDTPFASGSTDELLDDAVNGVETQSDHSVGDIIVTGNELVTNDVVGDWDTSDGVTSFTVTDGEIDLAVTSISGGGIFQVISTIIGETYLFSINVSAFSGGASIYIEKTHKGADLLVLPLSDTGIYAGAFVATGTTAYLNIREAGATDTCAITANNVSVTLKDTIYQNIVASTADDLLTDTEKFQVLTRVTRKDLILITKTGYKTVKGLHLFEANVSNDAIAVEYGYSKLGNGLYHDGTEEVIIAGLVDRLNSGGYHPTYNSFGCSKYDYATLGAAGSGNWYDDYSGQSFSDYVKSTYTTFIYDDDDNGDIAANVSGRPEEDPKFYDKIYFESNGGIIFKPTYTQQANEHDLLAENIDLDMAESCGVETSIDIDVAITDIAGDSTADARFTVDISVFGDTYQIKQEVAGEDWLFELFGYTVDAATARSFNDRSVTVYDGTDLYYLYANGTHGWMQLKKFSDDSIQQTIPTTLTFSVVKKAQHNLTQGTTLSIDTIGDPANYPSDWLSYLAGGNNVDFNLLLVEA